MKKTLLGIFSVAAIAVAVTSCKKETQEPLEPGTATVKGKLTANLDETTPEAEPIPAGTGVTFIIDGADLDRNPDPGYEYEDVIIRATVDANGNFTASLPARQQPIDVRVEFDDFEYNATIITTDENGFQTTATARRVYTKDWEEVTIFDGKVVVEDFAYDFEGTSFTETGKVKGMIEAPLYDDQILIEDYFFNFDWTAPGTTGSGFTIGQRINATGGSGSGLVVEVTNIGGSGELLDFWVVNPGYGYRYEDVITFPGVGNASAELVNGSQQDAPVENVVLTFKSYYTGEEFTAVTDANGIYEIILPIVDGMDYDEFEVFFSTFETESTFWEFPNPDLQTGPKIYSRGSTDFEVYVGDIQERDYTYGRDN